MTDYTPLPERDASKPSEFQGLFRKFNVERVDGTHEGCEYFVLDIDHDPCAKAALKAYAVESTRPLLSLDMRARYSLSEVEKINSMPISYNWFRGVLRSIPTRDDLLGGQHTPYVQRDEVLGWLDEWERRAPLAQTTQPASPMNIDINALEAQVLANAIHWGNASARNCKNKLDEYQLLIDSIKALARAAKGRV